MEILYPMFGMIVLTGVIMLALFFKASNDIKNFGNLKPKHPDELRPIHLISVTSPITTIICLNSLLCLCNRHLYLLVEHVDSLHIMLAWAYFLFRVIHSIVHVTINNVSIRASVFVFSLACLVIMIAREGLFFLTL